jgi:hypothetical protein
MQQLIQPCSPALNNKGAALYGLGMYKESIASAIREGLLTAIYELIEPHRRKTIIENI